nr:hypothetical protein [Tanacetum cinerariifolium]
EAKKSVSLVMEMLLEKELELMLVTQRGGDSLVRATTTTSSLEAEQDSCNIDKTQTKATSNEPSSQETSLGNGPRCQDTMGDTFAHTRLKHIELIKIYTTLQKKVLDLEDELKRTKTAQKTKIDGLERRVKKLEKKQRSRTHKLKRLYNVGLTARVIRSFDDDTLDKEDTSKQGRIYEINADEDITLVNYQEIAAATTVTIDDITLAKELEALKTSKPKTRGIVIKDHEEPSESRTTTIISSKKLQDKVARKLQEEIYKEERLVGKRARQEEEANIASIKTWEDIQAKVDADYQLAKRLQAEEQQELNEEEKAKLFMELLKKRRKAGNELEQETAKKQKIVDDKDTTNLKQLVKIIPEEDIAINAIPLAVKTLIVDWKIYKEGKKSYYQIIRVVKAKYWSIRPEEDYDKVLWGDLKVMFDPYVEDEVMVPGAKTPEGIPLLIPDKQLDGLPTHKEKYDVSFHTKIVFANMKRIGNGFSGKKTPLFPTMVGPNQVQMGEGSTQPTDIQHTPTFDMPLPKPKKIQKPRQPKRKTTKVPQPSESTNIAADEAVHKEGVAVCTHDDVSSQDYNVQDEGIEDVGEEEVVEVVTTVKMIVDAAQVTTAIVDIPVSASETIVTTAPTVTAESTKINIKVTQAPKRKGVMIQEPEETPTTKTASSQQPQVQDKAGTDEEDRLTRKRAQKEQEVNDALINTWDDIQDKIDADAQLA